MKIDYWVHYQSDPKGTKIVWDEYTSADVRKNVHAKKVIGGGEHDGATCWFECSSCHGSVDVEDAYCKHCGAVLEIGEMKDE